MPSAGWPVVMGKQLFLWVCSSSLHVGLLPARRNRQVDKCALGLVGVTRGGIAVSFVVTLFLDVSPTGLLDVGSLCACSGRMITKTLGFLSTCVDCGLTSGRVRAWADVQSGDVLMSLL